MTILRRFSYGRFAPALTAFILFAVLSALWRSDHVAFYRKVLIIWGVDVFDFPFLDTETVLSGARCLRAGVDVYVANPCDTLGRVYDYSPLWMLIAKAPVTLAWGVPVGLLIGLLYIGALTLLPEGRTGRHRIAIVLGAVSTVAAFAVERGNNDLILFALGAAAAALACRSPAFRLLGYGCALLAGLLKYYPMALMALAARERPARLIGIAAAAFALVALFVTLAWPDLTRALGLIPTGEYVGGMFGSIQVAGGLSAILGLPPAAVPLIRWTMTVGALGCGAAIALRPATTEALATLTLRERAFLLAGGLLTLACFFTAQNIGYRAIHLLLTLPALLALRRSGSRTFYSAATAALALLWSDCWRKGLHYLGKAISPDARTWLALLGWAIREALWWWLIALLAACVFALLRRSTVLRGSPPLLWA